MLIADASSSSAISSEKTVEMR
ncbi:MAG: hypothetical protein UY82_C0026G0001, partial [Candidatus Uhrbacteria bacterium GW2011_GWC2_53_7]